MDLALFPCVHRSFDALFIGRRAFIHRAIHSKARVDMPAFFDQLLESSVLKPARTRRGLTLPVSIGIHGVALVAVVVMPLLSWGELPEPDKGAVRAFFVETAPPPPPPPPPPAAAKAPAMPKVVQPKVKLPQEAPKFTAPIEVPERISPDPGSNLGVGDLPAGEPDGVPGGVEGGVKGGVVGGVVGGVLGGVPQPEATPPPPPPTPTPEPPKPTGPVRVGGQIKAPTKVANAPPVYPDIAKQARVQGAVVLEATISPSGDVTNVKVVRGIPLLNEAAVEAVRQWRYTPTLLNGVPVPVIMTVTVNFRLGA
jgi:protein TonB